MKDEIVTSDLTKFGYRELDMAADLLKAYANDKGNTDFLSDGINVFMNTNSGNVFLCDEDMSVGVLEDDKIVQFYSCSNCGYEGTQQDAKDDWTSSTTGKDRDIKDFEKFNGYCSKECENN